MRLLVWVALLILVIAGRWLWYQHGQESPSGAPELQLSTIDGGWRTRQATAQEWATEIAVLGQTAMGKRLTWRPLQHDARLGKGLLVWWHDGQQERLGYAPAAGEDGGRAILSIIEGLMNGSVVLYDVHGDPQLQARIMESFSPNWTLPPELIILSPPQ